jgi:hypothetical protein
VKGEEGGIWVRGRRVGQPLALNLCFKDLHYERVNLPLNFLQSPRPPQPPLIGTSLSTLADPSSTPPRSRSSRILLPTIPPAGLDLGRSMIPLAPTPPTPPPRPSSSSSSDSSRNSGGMSSAESVEWDEEELEEEDVEVEEEEDLRERELAGDDG